MRERVAVELLELVTRECPQVAAAYAGRGLEQAMRAAKIAAGIPVPTVIGRLTEEGGASSGDPRSEPEGEPTRPVRRRHSSTPALAAASAAAQHAVLARDHLEKTIDAIGATAKAAVAIDDRKDP